jgi:hypothetical protein
MYDVSSSLYGIYEQNESEIISVVVKQYISWLQLWKYHIDGKETSGSNAAKAIHTTD